MRSFDLNIILNLIGVSCWGVCFWWMHTISRRQENMLQELHKVMRRTEEVSKAEHELIKEVHPKIAKIEEDVDQALAQGVMPAESPSAVP